MKLIHYMPQTHGSAIMIHLVFACQNNVFKYLTKEGHSVYIIRQYFTYNILPFQTKVSLGRIG